MRGPVSVKHKGVKFRQILSTDEAKSCCLSLTATSEPYHPQYIESNFRNNQASARKIVDLGHDKSVNIDLRNLSLNAVTHLT
jgi:hypothetical protein